MARADSISIRRVLIATDLDPERPAPLVEGASIAEQFGATLGVVNVLPPGFPEDAISPHGEQARREDHTQERSRVTDVSSAVERSTGRNAGEIDIFIERGDPAVVIVERARRYPADLIVVGTHGRHGTDRFLLGSIAENVVRSSSCSVLVARGTTVRSHGANRILAACDAGPTTSNVLAWAGAFSRRMGAPVLAAHTVELSMNQVAMVATAIFSGAVPPQVDAETERSVKEAATGALRADLAAAGVLAETEVLNGPAAPILTARAKELGASLVVMGTHGRKGFARLALGSVAEHMVRDAECSVLVVR